jgi:hypothetical protein
VLHILPEDCIGVDVGGVLDSGVRGQLTSAEDVTVPSLVHLNINCPTAKITATNIESLLNKIVVAMAGGPFSKFRVLTFITELSQL